MMRHATFRDVPSIVRVVSDAFTREHGGASTRRQRVIRGLLTLLGEVLAVLLREAYVSDDRDVVVHVGKRGSVRASLALIGAQLLVALALVIAVLIVPALAATILWILVSPVAALSVALGLVVILGVAVIVWTVLSVVSSSRATEGPSLGQASFRKGAARPYWLVSNLATVDDREATALPLIRSWRPEKVPQDANVVAVARNDRLRRLYKALKFKPLPGSDWVLYRAG